MRAWMQPIIYWVNEYYGNRWYLLFAVVAYIYLFFATKESRRKIVYPSVLLAFLVLNPILYQYVYSKIIYWRLMWLLPNTLAIAYATVLFVRKRKHIAVKVIAFVLVLAAVVWKGTNVYTHSGMARHPINRRWMPEYNRYVMRCWRWMKRQNVLQHLI